MTLTGVCLHDAGKLRQGYDVDRCVCKDKAMTLVYIRWACLGDAMMFKYPIMTSKVEMVIKFSPQEIRSFSHDAKQEETSTSS